MQIIPPVLLILILLPVEIIGGILTIIIQTIKHANGITDIKGMKQGFLHGVTLNKEFWIFLKNYILTYKCKSDSQP